LTQTCPLPAGGAGWLALLFDAEALLDFAGFVVDAEFEDAGAVVLAGAGAAASEFDFEGLDAAADVFVSAVLVDFDFFVLADFVLESASFDAAVSVEEALADLDFFELVDFVPAAASVEAESALASVEEAFADLDFFELADFVPDAESAAAVSPEDDLVDLDFFELVEAVELPESLSEVDFAFFDFDVEDFFEASAESVELASAAFFDLLVFLAGAVAESLESVA
jgi:hypothetical protein